jgi:hypothetical protein
MADALAKLAPAAPLASGEEPADGERTHVEEI